MLPLVVLYALSTFPLTKAILHYTQPFFLLGMRMSIAGGILLLFMGLRKRITFNKAHIPLYVQATVFAIFIPYMLRYYGLHNTNTPRALLLYNCGPLITYLLAHIYSIEKITAQRTFFLGLGMSGLLLYLNAPLKAYCTPLAPTDCALIISVISFSYGWIIIRKLVVNLNYSPALVNGIAMFGGGIAALFMAWQFEQPPYVTHLWHFAVALTGIILISNLLAHNLYATLLRTYSLTLLQLGSLLAPIMTCFGQTLFTSTAVPFTTYSALLLIGTGFCLMYRQEKTARLSYSVENRLSTV